MRIVLVIAALAIVAMVFHVRSLAWIVFVFLAACALWGIADFFVRLFRRQA